jgi:hypothetical protein
MLVQLETFVTHLLKCLEALCRNFFLLLSEGVVYQVLKVVPLGFLRAKLIIRHTLNP